MAKAMTGMMLRVMMTMMMIVMMVVVVMIMMMMMDNDWMSNGDVKFGDSCGGDGGKVVAVLMVLLS